MSTKNASASAAAWGCRTDDILVAHAVFRRLFSLLPPAVRRVDAFDAVRARRIAGRIRLATGGLHHHHATEDSLLWDRLQSRAPACAIHVGLMRAQHDRIAGLLDQANEITGWWVVDGDPVVRDRLAELLAEASDALTEHLRAEEANVLPVVATVLSQLEWDDIGAHARKGTRPQHAFAMLGLLLAEGSPAQRAQFEAHIPRIAKVLYDLFGHLQYDRLMDDLDPVRAALAPRRRREGGALPAAS